MPGSRACQVSTSSHQCPVCALQLGGIGRDVMLLYDLELPLEFVPRPQVKLHKKPGLRVAGLGCLANTWHPNLRQVHAVQR